MGRRFDTKAVVVLRICIGELVASVWDPFEVESRAIAEVLCSTERRSTVSGTKHALLLAELIICPNLLAPS